MRFLKLVVLLLIFCLVVSGVSIAEEPIELQRIIITPNRFSQEFSESAAEITIISEEDIKNCGSQNLLDVLRPVKGILVKDYYGTGAKASVDMRGFGETAGNNVLVLVDGRRVNEVDLSGVNWAQIPVDRVKTIEILHGGTGAVLYGDNAVGGVINIITKEGDTDIPEIEIAQTVGSYQFNKQSVNAAGKNDSLSYSLNATRFDTNGYRENSEYRSFDAGVKLKYALTDYLKLKFSANSHEADFGLPGPLSLSDLETYSRRDSKSTEENNDVGEKDNYIKFGIEGMTFDIGTLNLDFAYRNKLSDTYWGTYSTINSTYKLSSSNIDTYSFTPNYTLNADLFGRDNKLIVGLDYYKIDSMLNDFSTTSGLQIGDSDIDKKSLGLYFNDSFDFTDKLMVDLGYRYERMRYDFDYIDYQGTYEAVDDFQKRAEEAWKVGGVYSVDKDTQIFANLSKSFRSPLTDEFLLYDFKGLSTQTSLGLEAGIRHAFNRYLKLDLAFFDMRIKNEIYYDPSTWLNSNYDKTRHQGLDVQLNTKFTKRISGFINYIYTRANFNKGVYDNNYIPMVPVNKASLGLNIGFWKNFKFVPMVTYVGSRYMISDQRNHAGKVKPYTTVDLRMSYEKDNCEVFLHANNIFNELYSEYAVTNSTASTKNFYPAPERNFAVGVSWKF